MSKHSVEQKVSFKENRRKLGCAVRSNQPLPRYRYHSRNIAMLRCDFSKLVYKINVISMHNSKNFPLAFIMFL